MGIFKISDKNKKSLVISAVVFSLIYIVSAFFTQDIYTALINVILWGCMCLGYSWAKTSKVALNIVLICVYAVSLWQIFMNSAETFRAEASFIFAVAVNMLIPVAELFVIYKSKGISSYFLEIKKNNMNLKR